MTIKKRNIEKEPAEVIPAWYKPQTFSLFFFGFSAGLPLSLIFSTLSIWLSEAGIERSAVTFFSWAALGYSFKFFWSPLVDLLPLPFLTRLLGRRRSWILFAQILIVTAIISMAMVNPSRGGVAILAIAFASVLLGFSAATQDIAIDAYRIECAAEEMQALLSSMYIAGYRMGMLVSGAGALAFAGYLGTNPEQYSYVAWEKTYLLMALVMMIGIITTLCIREPEHENLRRDGDLRSKSSTLYPYSSAEYVALVVMFAFAAAGFAFTFFYGGFALNEFVGETSVIAAFGVELIRFVISCAAAALIVYGAVKTNFVRKQMVQKSYIEPVIDFFIRYGSKTALLLLLLVGFYRLSDIVLGVTANIFYLDIGFSKGNIATISKTFGLGMTLLGGFLGGILSVRFGVYRILMVGALLSSLTNILFMLLAESGPNLHLLTLVIVADNLAGGIATTAFIAFLSSLTNVSFTAVQYAIFSSIMTLFPKLIGGYSGTMVESFGYGNFFLITAVMGVPVMLLVWLAWRIQKK